MSGLTRDDSTAWSNGCFLGTSGMFRLQPFRISTCNASRLLYNTARHAAVSPVKYVTELLIHTRVQNQYYCTCSLVSTTRHQRHGEGHLAYTNYSGARTICIKLCEKFVRFKQNV